MLGLKYNATNNDEYKLKVIQELKETFDEPNMADIIAGKLTGQGMFRELNINQFTRSRRGSRMEHAQDDDRERPSQ